MIMPGPQRISGEAFALERLREHADLDYATLRREAEAAGVTMQPIQYGRARKQLGLPPLTTRRPPELRATPVAAPGEPATVEPAATAAPSAAPRKKGSAAFDFLLQELRAEPGLAYAELRGRAAAAGLPIAPIMYGRAKAVLGLVPVRPRGKRGATAGIPAAGATAPRTLKQVESVAADRFSRQLEEVRSLEQLVAAVKELDAERRRLRELLERVVTMIDEALG